MREFPARMQARERLEKMALESGRVRNTAVAQQKGEYRSKRGPQDQQCDHDSGARVIQFFHEL